MRNILGIDFGTTNSLIGYLDKDTPKLIPNSRDSLLTPSVVGMSETGDLLVGEAAKNQSIAFPDRTVASIKRMLGEDKTITLGKEQFTPQEIAGAIIKRLKLDAEEHLGEIVEEAVITVPAYFSDAQRQAVKDAGEIAGFVVERILNEPTAAALAYGINSESKDTIMVYDFGGGTFDVSIIRAREGAFRVLATNGDVKLGGDDMDWAIAEWLKKNFKKSEKVDLEGKEIDEIQRRVIQQRLKDAAETAKKDLTEHLETTINLPFIYTESEEPKHLKATLSRTQLEEIIEPFIEKTKSPLEKSMKDAKLKYEDLDSILLVGGTTRIPKVKQFVEDLVGKTLEHKVDPEQSVALGAAIQAGVKRGKLQEMVIVDVAPHSLGIEVKDGKFSVIIPRNTAIPCSKKKPYVTTQDMQTEAQITVYQGEKEVASANPKLGDFVFSGIDSQEAGKALVDVLFDYDINGIVKVTAKDRATKKVKSVSFKTSQKRLTAEEVREAQLEIGVRTSQKENEIGETSEANALIYEAEAFIRDRKKFIEKPTKDSLRTAIANLQRAIDHDEDKVKSEIEHLQIILSDAEITVMSAEDEQKNEEKEQKDE